MYNPSIVKFQLCICIIMMLYTPSFEEEVKLNATYRSKEAVQKCSNILSNLLNSLCDKAIKIVKRDVSLMMEKLTSKDLQNHMNKKRLLAAESWRRVRRQIATECCDNPCTIKNIIMYCPDNARLVQENPEIFYEDDDE